MHDSTAIATDGQLASITPECGHVPISECGHVSISEWTLDSICPSPENEALYAPVNHKDPEVRALAKSILEHGIREPIVITEDGWILSGHRRYMGARLAGLESVPCRVEPFCKDDDHDRFMVLLREYNRQRIKTFSEKVREEIISADPNEAYESLIEHRQELSEVTADTIAIRGEKHRAEISGAKGPFLRAIQEVVERRREFWPLSDRQIHYALLNDPPLKHASKPDSVYANDLKSYKALTDLLTRARLEGDIGMGVIADPTRPVTIWSVHSDSQAFLRGELDSLFKGYWRNLMQSQPNHIEIVGEKNTVLSVIQPIAAQYCIPLTIGRGFCSLPPRAAIAQRFRDSGKERLILLILSDFDPDGEEIAHSLARSLRDDFYVGNIKPIKVTLTAGQVRKFKLRPKIKAKKTSPNYKRFEREHGDNVFELEALEPETLQKILTEAIDSVIDVEAFNFELNQEREDSVKLQALRVSVQEALGDIAGELE